jgi:putative transposase
VELILEANENGARLIPACDVAGISVRTYERWRKGGDVAEDRRALAIRKPPTNKLTAEEYQYVLEIVNTPEYADLPPAQIVPSLADAGIYIASESTMYRILRKELMQKHRGRSKPPIKVKHPTTHIAIGPNEVWTWDITYLYSHIQGMYYKLYMVMDIFSRKIVGWEVWETESGELASILMERAVINEKIKGKPLVLHSDNGAPMKSYTLKAKLEMLGVIASYSRPRVSNDNPYSESLFKTCKYRSNYPHEGFKFIEEARQWVYDFVDWYNNKHYHSGLNFMSPVARHTGEATHIMEKRKIVYDLAKKRHPGRFNRGTRKWDLPETVALNPTDEIKANLQRKM